MFEKPEYKNTRFCLCTNVLKLYTKIVLLWTSNNKLLFTYYHCYGDGDKPMSAHEAQIKRNFL